MYSHRLIIYLLLSLALHGSLLGISVSKPASSVPAQRLHALLRLPQELPKLPDLVPLSVPDSLLKNTVEDERPSVAPPRLEPPPVRNRRKSVSKSAVTRQEIQTVQRKLAEYVFYPEQAKRLGLEGTVRLFVELSNDGHVLDVRIIDSTGYPILDNAAIKGFYAIGRLPGESDIWAYTFQLEE